MKLLSTDVNKAENLRLPEEVRRVRLTMEIISVAMVILLISEPRDVSSFNLFGLELGVKWQDIQIGCFVVLCFTTAHFGWLVFVAYKNKDLFYENERYIDWLKAKIENFENQNYQITQDQRKISTFAVGELKRLSEVIERYSNELKSISFPVSNRNSEHNPFIQLDRAVGNNLHRLQSCIAQVNGSARELEEKLPRVIHSVRDLEDRVNGVVKLARWYILAGSVGWHVKRSLLLFVTLLFDCVLPLIFAFFLIIVSIRRIEIVGLTSSLFDRLWS